MKKNVKKNAKKNSAGSVYRFSTNTKTIDIHATQYDMTPYKNTRERTATQPPSLYSFRLNPPTLDNYATLCHNKPNQ